MKHIVVDLEMNNVSKNAEEYFICKKEVIEIGAVMLDENWQQVAEFKTLVKPQFNECIVPMIQELTGITTEMVENAPSFEVAFKMFTKWCLGTGNDVKIYAWSNSDYSQMMHEIRAKKIELSADEQGIMESEWNDFQKEFGEDLGFEKQVSLEMALEMAGINFKGRQHTALDDAKNTAKLMQIFRDKAQFNKYFKKIEAMMKPASLGVTLGSLFDMSKFVVA